VSGVIEGLQNDVFEICCGMTEGLIQASRAELDKSFEQMNLDPAVEPPKARIDL